MLLQLARTIGQDVDDEAEVFSKNVFVEPESETAAHESSRVSLLRHFQSDRGDEDEDPE